MNYHFLNIAVVRWLTWILLTWYGCAQLRDPRWTLSITVLGALVLAGDVVRTSYRHRRGLPASSLGPAVGWIVACGLLVVAHIHALPFHVMLSGGVKYATHSMVVIAGIVGLTYTSYYLETSEDRP